MVEKNGSSEEIRENTNIPMELKELGKRVIPFIFFQLFF